MWGRKSNVAVMVCGRATQQIRAYFTRVFQPIVQSAEWLDNPAVSCCRHRDRWREGGREGASELRRRGPASRQPGQLGPGPAAVEVITAYLLTWRWKRCQPLSHRVAVRAVVFERVPITQASPDY